jgi:hypothetical protein
MAPFGKIAAFGSATVATAAAASLTWVAMSRGPQKLSGQQPEPPPSSARVIVCAGQDSILRAVDAAVAPMAGCPPGQARVLLTPDDPGAIDPLKVLNADDDAGAKRAPDTPKRSDDRIGELERRLDNLRLSPLFTVVDARDQPIFVVRPKGVLVYNADGVPVTALRATADGGLLKAISSDGALTTAVDASSARAGVRLSEGDAPRLEAGTQISGRYALRILSPDDSGDIVAGIGESRAGTGAVLVADVNGHVRASMTIDDGKGTVSVLNGTGIRVASLSESPSGAGLLRIANAERDVAVKMGVNQDRYGAVMTGPRAGLPYVPSSGLPGSYFFGCSGGDACKN